MSKPKLHTGSYDVTITNYNTRGEVTAHTQIKTQDVLHQNVVLGNLLMLRRPGDTDIQVLVHLHPEGN